MRVQNVVLEQFNCIYRTENIFKCKFKCNWNIKGLQSHPLKINFIYFLTVYTRLFCTDSHVNLKKYMKTCYKFKKEGGGYNKIEVT